MKGSNRSMTIESNNQTMSSLTTTTTTTTISRSSLVSAVVVVIGTVGTMLILHAGYMTQLLRPHHLSTLHSLPSSSSSSFNFNSNFDTDDYLSFKKIARRREELPELFIYRRTKKTGSSSMLTALLNELRPFGYHALYSAPGEEMDAIVRNEWQRHESRRLFIAEHNHITRKYHPIGGNYVVIADTIRDGYSQMTSYCRYVQKVKSCDSLDMIQCLKENENATAQINYRWAGNDNETEDTYIDLPLSSNHPALSTSVLQTIFPNVTLDIAKFNVKNSACPKIENVLQAYLQVYGALDEQVQQLRERMLTLTGYPYKVDKKLGEGKIGIEDMLKKAEEMEKEKYDMEEKSKVKKKRLYSEAHRELIRTMKHWTKENGDLVIKTRRKP